MMDNRKLKVVSLGINLVNYNSVVVNDISEVVN